MDHPAAFSTIKAFCRSDSNARHSEHVVQIPSYTEITSNQMPRGIPRGMGCGGGGGGGGGGSCCSRLELIWEAETKN